MANASPQLTAISAGGSIHNSSLLTPPLSPTLSTDTPFKANPDDNISLSLKHSRRAHEGQKEKKHSRRRMNRTCLSSEELRVTPPDEASFPRPCHSRSMPSLALTVDFKQIDRRRSSVKIIGTGSADVERRRWTLPSKAASTRSRAPTILAEHKLSVTAAPAQTGLLSPAMITLRRATTIKPTEKRMSLTFFPEPKFERSRIGILSAFLRTLNGNFTKHEQSTWPRPESRRSSSASMSSNGVQPSERGNASPVCTKVADVQPTILQPNGSAGMDSLPRRCSTKYISNEQVYEVIWDENITSSSGTTSPEAVAASQTARRKSVAVDALETQLHRASTHSSHRQSDDQGRPKSRSSSSGTQRHGSLQSMLGFKLSRFINDAALQDLPRSKSSKLGKSKSHEVVPHMHDDVYPKMCGITEYEQAKCSIEFFPPLRSRATTATSKPDTEPASRKHSVKASTPPELRWSRIGARGSIIGSMLGASSHTRRPSAAGPSQEGRRRSNTVVNSRRSSRSARKPSLLAPVEVETTPLLSTVGMLA